MQINERIKQIRQTIGLTQAKFAKHIAISTGYLAEMELGVKKINERIIRLIVAEFNVSDHWLRTGEGVMFSEATDKQLLKAVSLYKSLNPELQECALTQLAALAKIQNSNKS